jgi:CHAT domain-containing protein
VAVDTENHLIVAHEVTNTGTDRAQLANMASQASGSLSQMPFSVLLTKRPNSVFAANLMEYRKLNWLGAAQPITMLPSSSALTLRKNINPSEGSKGSYLGIGNPLLDGDGTDRALTERARRQQSCDGTPGESEKIGTAENKGNLSPKSFVELTDDGLAKPDSIKHWRPLPESADELCKVAASMDPLHTLVLLGATATEGEIKRRSLANGLREYRVIHFSTHGLLASESRGPPGTISEPALVLTPPRVPSQADDGLLTASEIALLNFDADWVVLSACNSAAGSSDNSEPLSGLARAILYAGARGVRVSHWRVDAEASNILIRKVFALIGSKGGRAEALQGAIEHMIGHEPDISAAHPEYWAPFVLIGQ